MYTMHLSLVVLAPSEIVDCCRAARNSTMATDAAQQAAQQQLVAGILGILGLNLTDILNATSPTGAARTGSSDSSLFG